MSKVNFAKQVAFVCETINMTAFCLSLHANHRVANKHFPFYNYFQQLTPTIRLFIARFAFPRSLFLLPTHPHTHTPTEALFVLSRFWLHTHPTESLAYRHTHTRTLRTLPSLPHKILALRQIVHILSSSFLLLPF